MVNCHKRQDLRTCTVQVDLSWMIAAVLLLSLLGGCRKTPVQHAGQTSTQQHEAEVADHDSARHAAGETDGYIGSQSCQSCHADISTAYAEHSMGKSAMLLTADTPVPAAEHSQFEADGFRYVMQQRGADWVHHQGRLTESGEMAEVDLPVSHVIGSGKNGQSFLVDRDGFLFMSPMTWYPAKAIWDLSPGYEKNNSQFNRPVIEECLYCHTDGAHAIHSSLNHYEDPIVRAHAIGCERCHGPGEMHVAAMQDQTSLGDSQIINPAKLQPALREAVCEQCHLSGAARVLKSNRQLNDFRPGQPLSSTYTIFTLAGDGKEFVGHVEQMHQSRCFQASNGQLGCISCHDPHSLPTAAAKIQFYRDRCLHCHSEDKGCSLDLSERLATSTEDDCVLCHMPQRPTEIRHAAVTDHSVPRLPDVVVGESRVGKQLLAFPDPASATPRDKSVALVRVSMRHPDLLGEATFALVLATLEKVVRDDPQDLAAADALAEIYLADDRVDDALQLCLRVLAAAPQRETTLLIVCETYSSSGQHQQAVAYWEQILGANPWMSKYWYSLGKSYASLQRWSRCRQLAVEGKKRFPTSIGLRHLLVESNLQLGDHEAAESEYQEIVRFNPAKLDSLKQWFQSHPLRQ